MRRNAQFATKASINSLLVNSTALLLRNLNLTMVKRDNLHLVIIDNFIILLAKIMTRLPMNLNPILEAATYKAIILTYSNTSLGIVLKLVI